jgi:hypothetical protein
MKRKISLLLICALFLTGLVPHYAVFPQEHTVLLNILENQPLLQYYCSLASIPVTIVNRLFAENATAPGGATPARRQDQPPTNAAAEFSLPTSQKTSVRNQLDRFSPAGGLPCTPVTGISLPYPALSQSDAAARRTIPGDIGIYLLLTLMLFIMLPRGALDAAAALRAFNDLSDPIWQSISGFLFVRSAHGRAFITTRYRMCPRSPV